MKIKTNNQTKNVYAISLLKEPYLNGNYQYHLLATTDTKLEFIATYDNKCKANRVFRDIKRLIDNQDSTVYQI